MFSVPPVPGAGCRCRFLPGAGPRPAEMQIQRQAEEINLLSAKHLHFLTNFSLRLHSSYSILSGLDKAPRAARAPHRGGCGRMWEDVGGCLWADPEGHETV